MLSQLASVDAVGDEGRPSVRIVCIDKTTEGAWLVCLKEWAHEPGRTDPRADRATAHRAAWYRRLKDHGLRVKLALADDGVVGGMIQYLPIEHSGATGRDLYFVQCTWVHGYAEGPGNLQGRGMGKALLAAAERDVMERGAKGLAAWGNTFPGWMPVAWLLRQGYVEADRAGARVLVWKAFVPDALEPKWRVPRKTPPRVPGEVRVTAFLNPWCSDSCDFHERVAEVVPEVGDDVRFERVDTSSPEVLNEWGIENAVFVNDRQITRGVEELREVIQEELGHKN